MLSQPLSRHLKIMQSNNVDYEKNNSVSEISKTVPTSIPKVKPANPSWICKNCKEANPQENEVCSKCGQPKLSE